VNKKYDQLSKLIESKKIDGIKERILEFQPVSSIKLLAENATKFVKMGDAKFILANE